MPRRFWIGIALLVALALPEMVRAADPALKCEAAKNKLAGKYFSCRANAIAKARKKSDAPDFTKCADVFSQKWVKQEQRAESKGGSCTTTGDESVVRTQLGDWSFQLELGLAGVFSCAFSGGTMVGGACWLLGAAGQSCEGACSAARNGTYDDATRTQAGSEGSDTNCDAVMDALGGGNPPASTISCGAGLGCHFNTVGLGRGRCTEPTTSAASPGDIIRRACACM